MWYTENLTVSELYESIATDTIDNLFRLGLKTKNELLAVSAMEELLRRGDNDMVVDGLNDAFDSDWTIAGSPTHILIANSLAENAMITDSLLCSYGKALRRTFMKPTDWARANADRLRKFPLAKAVRDANPWVAQYIWPNKKYEYGAPAGSNAKRNKFNLESFKDFVRNL